MTTISEESVIAAIRDGKNTFGRLLVAHGLTYESADMGRLDKALQRLRKRGVLRYEGGRWSVVDA